MSSAAGEDGVPAEEIEKAAGLCAPRFAERGMTAAEARQLAAEDAQDTEDEAFWLAIAAELDAIEARGRFRVI